MAVLFRRFCVCRNSKMMLYLGAAVVALALSGVRGQQAAHNYQNCAGPNEIKSGAGVSVPPPAVPFLPDSFQVRVEVNILNKRTSYSAVEYVDKPKNRAALRIMKNNTMDYLIFDDNNNQIIYDVNNNCYADMLSNDTNARLVGMKTTANTSIPHIYSTADTLLYAQKNGLTYMGKATIRGIETDHWLSCMFWPSLAANFTLHFYWSGGGHMTTTADDESVKVGAMVASQINPLRNIIQNIQFSQIIHGRLHNSTFVFTTGH